MLSPVVFSVAVTSAVFPPYSIVIVSLLLNVIPCIVPEFSDPIVCPAAVNFANTCASIVSDEPPK